MLNPEVTSLLTETVSHLQAKHHAELNKSLREWKFEMQRRGTYLSSIYQQGIARIFGEAFEVHSNRVWSEMQRVLEQTGFEPYSGCENDLADVLKGSLEQVYKGDHNSLQGCEPSTKISSGPLDLQFRTAVSRLTTEIKIFCQRIRIMKEKAKAPSSMQVTYNLTGAHSRVNIGSTDQSINVCVTEQEFFLKLREAIEGQISDDKTKARLLQMLVEGEGLPKKTDLFNNWFTRFLSLAADSISVIQPFVPALAQMLAQATT